VVEVVDDAAARERVKDLIPRGREHAQRLMREAIGF
jgi:hypothetical protein